jgi:formate dehydrogenase major subunit
LIGHGGFVPDVAADPDRDARDLSHPYLVFDRDRCIDCYRCVRACAEVQGQFVWHVRGRGIDTRLEPDGATLRESSCVSCGTCVDACPTRALEDRAASPLLRPTQWTRTVCPYCGVGCELDVGSREGRIISVRPVLESPVSKGHLCVKGRYAFDFVNAPDRITGPMIREGTGWRRVSWSEARAFVIGRLRAIIERHGADSVGVLGSARATNEDNYVTQKFARTVLGTNNVDCCARVCHAPSAVALKRMLGTGLSTNAFDDIESACTILLCGANPTENHPVVGARIRQAALGGAHLIVVDPRRIELARHAEIHLAVAPGTNIPLFNAMARTIVNEGLYDREFVSRRVEGFNDFKAFLEPWTVERAAGICGVEADLITRAARLFARETPAMTVTGLGLTEHVQGTETVMALINLALLTGNLGRPGTGVNALRGQNNVQGAAHMGCEPATLPASTALEEGRQTYERAWGTALPALPGLTVLQMMDAAAAGRLKALWAVGYDVLMTNPDVTSTQRALDCLDLLVVQDLFLTETARASANVFLPACSSFEKDGTFMNAERRVQRVRAAIRPLGDSKPDWQIMSEFARAMGASGFAFATAEDIWNELRTLSAGARGMTYARLDVRGLQWPCPSEDHPGTPILHTATFGGAPRAALRMITYHPTSETTTTGYPLCLITGRSLYQFNAGTMTGRTRNNELRPADLLDISPEDAERAHIAEGATVRVTSRYGSVRLPAHINTAVRPGQLFATFQRPDVLVNAVTGPGRDAITGTPEYKITAVRLETVS